MRTPPALPILLASALTGLPLAAAAQPLGSFIWQLQPFCNRVTVNVRQDGAVYTLDGFDDQCGAAQRAPLVGMATPNPDGTIGFGLNIVLPDGQSGTVEARISLSGLSGTWRDAGGNTGPFAFGAATGGLPRPVATPGSGDITAVAAGTGLTGGGASGDVSLAVNPVVVQSRVTTACTAGQALRSIGQDGTAVCEPITGSAGGDITAVAAGTGLTGGGTSGDVSLAVAFGIDGVLPAAARADHGHLASGVSSVAVGPGALSVNTNTGSTAVGVSALLQSTGAQNTAVGFEAARSTTIVANNTALGFQALRDATTGGINTAVGSFAAAGVTTGASNTAVGVFTLGATGAGQANVAVGRSALQVATSSDSTAAGTFALQDATTGAANTAIGRGALRNVTTGSRNVALGALTGDVLLVGSGDTLVGHNAEVGSDALENATAIGVNARVDASDALVLGGIAGINGATVDVGVGIGTTTPGARLDIASEDTGTDLRITVADGSPDIAGRSSGGTRAAPSAVPLNGALLILRGQGHTGTDFQEGAAVVLRAVEPWTTTAHGSRVEFQTTTIGTTNQNTRVVIEDQGEVGIGTTTPLDQLDVVGNIRVGTGTIGCVRDRDGTIIAGTCASDRRFKRNIVAFAPTLERVAALRPVHYYWRAAEFPAQGFGDRRSYGLIAQEVEAVLPELVVTDADGYKAVNYSALPLLAIQAIKEMKARSDALAARNAELEARLDAIERALAADGHPLVRPPR